MIKKQVLKLLWRNNDSSSFTAPSPPLNKGPLSGGSTQQPCYYSGACMIWSYKQISFCSFFAFWICPSIFHHPWQSDFYIHAVFFSSQAQLRHLLLSAHAPMKLVIFDPQQILQVAAAPSVCVYEVTGCMHILRLYVFSLAFSAPQGTFQSQRNFWRVVRTPKTVLKSLSNSCRHISAVVTITLLEREQAPYLYLYPARGDLHLQIFILWGKMETSGFLSFDKCWQKEPMCNYFLTGLFRLVLFLVHLTYPQ